MTRPLLAFSLFASFTFASSLLVACGGTSCPPGSYPSAGRCIRIAGDAGPGVDAGPRPDSGPEMDAGPGEDAGPLEDGGPRPDGALDGAVEGDGGPGDGGPAGVAGLCEPCATDAACVTGLTCVSVGGAPRCHWLVDAAAPGPAGSCLARGRPFSSQRTLTSESGAEVTVCVAAASSCAAFLDYRSVSCTDATGCGTGGADAACRDADPSDGEDLRCTMACLTDDDCPTGADCDRAAGECEFP